MSGINSKVGIDGRDSASAKATTVGSGPNGVGKMPMIKTPGHVTGGTTVNGGPSNKNT